jgi:hypothetical protein
MRQQRSGTRKLKTLARRYVWWMPPAECERDPDRLIRQVLSLGTVEDYFLMRDHFGRQRIIQSLQSSPPGAIDPRSWNYWHRHFRLPVPAQPKRRRSRARS